ncbi:LamG-like jellyroll fold domain-containing protein [Spongiactinospora sp. TRM90649]|uniref:LamG-like jellyroll fold domain-containing protein n=1 Tax=Spongiactinospora sp. TRM90649 TaxID=3031114 RepID=UPI0023F64111|nr:LamG-like jellyroll fold domain-containing protein [Spongiactinospora sp. TRM90649]MDF5759204.1 DNRLRE domain-containing protein [Spongiactinospora sp. TRM90649]
MRRTPRGLLTVVLSLLAGCLTAAGVPQTAAVAQAVTAKPPPRTEREALDRARQTKQRVEALALRTEARQVFANPDGTFTSETSALPERVRRGDGWADVDPSLVFAADGSVRTVATPLELTFSGGGAAPLAVIGEEGRSVAMTWPGSLPKPSLAGDTATYAEVLPGVDLKVTASVLGFSEVLVVKSREAAADPALRELDFGLRADGLSVRKTDSGGLSAVTESGTEVFHAPAPRMWDSSATPTAEPKATASLNGGPPSRGRQAVMGVEVAKDRIVITPDKALLTGPETTYPVYLDPQWSGSKLAWAMVDRAFPSQEYWNSSHMPEAGNYGSGLKRSFFRMDSDNVNGKHILKATFRITQVKSWGCTSSPQAVQLWLTGGISTSTNWSRQPSWSDHQDSVATDAGYSSSCPDKGIEFNVTSAIVRAAKSGWPNTTFGLKDSNDTSSGVWGWKGFSNAPKLVIDYNTPPAAPSGIGTYPATPCVTGAARPSVNAGDADSPLQLKAKIYDPDKANDGVRAEFILHHYNTATGVWDDITATMPGGGKTAYKNTTSATDHSVKLSALVNGHSYSYKVKAYDGTDSSAWSKWCEFTVDTVDPATLPKVTSLDYPADTPDAWQGSVGWAGGFTLAPGDGESDVTAFRWALDDPALATAATQVAIPAGQTTVNIRLAPRHDWLNALYVFPVDRAGNVGKTPAVYGFYVNAGFGPEGHWKLDETSGTTAADSGATTHPATVAGGAGWAGARVAGGLRLNGSTGYASTDGPVVHTDRSMSVSAWVLLNDKSKNYTVAGQDAVRSTGFQLYYAAGSKRWVFSKFNADVDDKTTVWAIGDTEAMTGIWTHLTGVYDAPRKQLRLYVNGLLSATASYPYTPFDATGPLQIGRVRWHGTYIENFAGDIDDVKIWKRELSDDPRTVNDPSLGNEIAAMAKQPPIQRGLWRFEETSGTTAVNTIDSRWPAALAGGATWAGDGFDGGGALALNGTTGYAATPSAPLRTDHSYAVTAWVRLSGDDTCVLPNRVMTVLAQDGSIHSSFYLSYRMFSENGVLVPRWSFSTSVAPDATSGVLTHTSSAEPVDCSALNTWTHLAGVYDEQAKQIRLYVNGQLNDQRTVTGGWSAGALQIGRARYKSAAVDYFGGEVDDVRAYTGTLTDRQVLNIAMNLPTDS